MVYYKNTSINTKIAPIVKWYNMSMVRTNFKFDSWWGHQAISNYSTEQKKIFLFFDTTKESINLKLWFTLSIFFSSRFIKTR